MKESEFLSGLYRKMVLIRTLETQLLQIAESTGEVTDLHLSRGQEAISVGVCSAIRADDYMVTHHRTIAHSIAKGMPLQLLVDELLGKATGVCGGRANEMHIRYPRIGYMFSFQLVGTAVPVAAGVAWASRYVRKEDRIVALFIGDASTSNAQFFEGVNAASLRKVPLLIVVEDNHLAGNIGPEDYFPNGTSIENRFSAFGVDCVRIDGNKIDSVVEATERALEYVRNTPVPYALICDTTRLLMHKIGQPDVRTKEEVARLEERDPIRYLEGILNVDGNQRVRTEKEVLLEVQSAVARARSSPWPETDQDLFAARAS